MLIAQLTDLHILPPGRLAQGRIDPAACLSRAVAALAALDPRPDLALLTGDLVDGGRPEEYGLLKELLAPMPCPYFVIPGNHDDRGALTDAFRQARYLPRDGGFLDYAVEDWPVRLIGLDTLVPGEDGGALSAARLGWLDALLAGQPRRPTVLFLHHPPFATGIGFMDRIGLADAGALKSVVARHPRIERLLSGHLHRAIQVRWAGTLASTAPSTMFQIALDLTPDGPPAFTLEPPGFQLHLWREDTGLISHTVPVGDFEGPYRFGEG